jgi:hypothetical protein
MSRNIFILIAVAIVTSAIAGKRAGIDVFSAGGSGHVLGGATATIVVAIVLALVPAGIYWLVNRRPMPYLVTVMWGIWLFAAWAVFSPG